jgi:uncharacterized membrane protein
MRNVSSGQIMFALASASLAVLALTYGSFSPGQNLPAWLPWRNVWVDVSALVLLAASIGLCFPKIASRCALIIVTYLGIWAAISVPQFIAQPLSVGAWYGFIEALTSIVGAWILFVELLPSVPSPFLSAGGRGSVRAAQVLFGLCCVFYGYSHFVYANYTASMVPGWLPAHLTLAYITGAAHIAAGVGIIVGVLPGLAAILEASMMSLFGMLVWIPSFFIQPTPTWASPPQARWSELVVNLLLAASAWIVAQLSIRRSIALEQDAAADRSQVLPAASRDDALASRTTRD